jgi:hypothetical protein
MPWAQKAQTMPFTVIFVVEADSTGNDRLANNIPKIIAV